MELPLRSSLDSLVKLDEGGLSSTIIVGSCDLHVAFCGSRIRSPIVDDRHRISSGSQLDCCSFRVCKISPTLAKAILSECPPLLGYDM